MLSEKVPKPEEPDEGWKNCSVPNAGAEGQLQQNRLETHLNDAR